MPLSTRSVFAWIAICVSMVAISRSSSAQSPILRVENLVEGSIARVEVSNCVSGDVVLIGYSLAGPGPTQTSLGPVDLSPPIELLPTVIADASGIASLNSSVPPRSAGIPVWVHAADLTSGLLSNSWAGSISSDSAPMVTDVVPAQVDQGGLLGLTLTGKFFVGGAQIEIERGAQLIELDSEWVATPQLMGGVADFAGAEPGFYDVRVINPSGMAGELQAGVEVLSVAPQVNQIEPDRAREGETVSVSVVGEFFDQGASARLSLNGAIVQGSSVWVSEDGRMLTAEFVLDQGAGVFDVIVEDPDSGVGTLPTSFEVSAYEFGVMEFVPGGTFEMGDHFGVGNADELPIHTVTVSDIWMDKYLVPVQSYVAFLNESLARGEIFVDVDLVRPTHDPAVIYVNLAAMGLHFRWTGDQFEVRGGKALRPVPLINLEGMFAYANWRSRIAGLEPCYDAFTWAVDFNASGYRLPTEAEWEYSARGNTASYTKYYWGNQIDGSHANFSLSGDPWDNSSTPVGYYNGNQIPAGVDMANPFGLYDMSGNLWEVCQDYYAADYYSWSPSNNPTGPATGTERVQRGGDWSSPSDSLRSARRSRVGGGQLVTGFRLVSRR